MLIHMKNVKRELANLVKFYLEDNSLEDLFEELDIEIEEALEVLWGAGLIDEEQMKIFLEVE